MTSVYYLQDSVAPMDFDEERELGQGLNCLWALNPHKFVKGGKWKDKTWAGIEPGTLSMVIY